MPRLRNHPLFAAIVFASAVACVAEAGLIYSTRQRVRRAISQLETKRQQRDELARQSPALNEENSRAIEADVAAAETRLGELRAVLAGKVRLPEPPSRPVDAYFALGTFVAEMRLLATREQVALRADERFGFATHARGGPAPELLAAVHRQRCVMQHLLEILFEARPHSLIAAQRERPLTEAQRSARWTATVDPRQTVAVVPSAGDGAETSADFFTPESRLRSQVQGLAAGELYRLEFVGPTRVLRAFLNSLASSSLPLFVRAVEVEPDAESVSLVPSVTPAAMPVVTRRASRFVVVVECLELAPTAPTS